MALYAGVVFLLLLIGVSSGVYDNDKVSAMDDDDLYEQLVDLQRRHVDWLLDHPDVTGVDVNYKKVGGEHTDQLSLVIGVKEKLTDDALTHERRLPKHIEGFQTDIIEEELAVATQGSASMPFAHNDSYTDPPDEDCPCRHDIADLRGGDCLKIKDSDCFGTLGYFTRAARGEFGILSNFHVTLGPPNRLTSAPPPNPMFPNDYVADVRRVAFDNKVDASHSRFCYNDGDIQPPNMLSDGTVVLGTQRARCWDRVRYCGCTAGCTPVGRIHSTNWCGLVYYPKPDEVRGVYKFCNQILFTPATQNGDCGSLLINADTNRATGLVFARIGNRYGLANRIGPVLNRLGVNIAT